MAREIIPSAMSVLLMLVILYARDLAWTAPAATRRRAEWIIAAAMFWMTLSDLVIVSAFFAVALGLLSIYGINGRLTFRRWGLVYVVPVIAAFALFQIQLALGRTYLGSVPSLGTSELVRMGLAGRDAFGLGGHKMIFTYGRDQWAWWGFGSMAMAGLVAVLVRSRNPEDADADRDLDSLLPFAITYILLASMFSELVLNHPYIYDLLLIVPSVLIVCVHVPIALCGVYRRQGVVALAVLMFSMMYVWVSIVDYAIMVRG